MFLDEMMGKVENERAMVTITGILLI
jgi:hypothetical protein